MTAIIGFLFMLAALGMATRTIWRVLTALWVYGLVAVVVLSLLALAH